MTSKCPIKIPECLGEWSWSDYGKDFDCGYENAPTCDECVINFRIGGVIDPRTGRRIRGYKKLSKYEVTAEDIKHHD